jgi:hypothetical protein
MPQPPPPPLVNDREGPSMARPLRHDARVSEEMQRLRGELDALALEPEPSHLTHPLHPSSTAPTQRGSRGGGAVRGGRRVSGAPARPQRTSRPSAPVTGLRFDNVLAL